MKILVTGGAGFIGSTLVDTLIKQGHHVSVVDNLSTGRLENINEEATFYHTDILDSELTSVFEQVKPEVVYHLAAQIDVQFSIKNPDKDAEVNILGTIKVLECCQRHGVGKIIYASSAAIYGEPSYLGIDEKHPIHPISYYGNSKLTSENYIHVYSQLYGMKHTILRFANVYGPRQMAKGEGGVVAIFTDRAKSGEILNIFGDGEQTRDFIYVQDIVAANVNCLRHGDNGTFNIGTGYPLSVNELVAAIESVFRKGMKVNYLEPRQGDILHSYFDNKKAKNTLNWKPQYSLEQGLSEMFDLQQVKEAFE